MQKKECKEPAFTVGLLSFNTEKSGLKLYAGSRPSEGNYMLIFKIKPSILQNEGKPFRRGAEKREVVI